MNMATYETFAAVYDAVMDDSLYDLWTDFSLRHLPKSKDRKKLLELACGTGIQSVRFSQAGFDVTGLDLSADMLKIAEKRAASAKQKIDFIEGNMLDLSQAGTYDFVTCYSDSICYMQDEVEVGDVFREVYNALNEDGVFRSVIVTLGMGTLSQLFPIRLSINSLRAEPLSSCFTLPLR